MGVRRARRRQGQHLFVGQYVGRGQRHHGKFGIEYAEARRFDAKRQDALGRDGHDRQRLRMDIDKGGLLPRQFAKG